MENNLMDLSVPMNHAGLCEAIARLCDAYDFLVALPLGQSVLGRTIPRIVLGDPDASVGALYVGAHHGMEWITSMILLQFVCEYCEAYQKKETVYRLNMEMLFRTRRIDVIPMLNPDGVEYQQCGVTEDNPIRERLLRMNGGSEDFSRWQANGRGVDLNHNYNAGFDAYKKLEREAGIENGAPTRYSGEHPESEPETSALCNLLRYADPINLILTLHTQGEEIYYTSGGETAPHSRRLAETFSRMTGYALAEPDGMAAYGGLTDWYIREFSRPSFTVECGRGENPLPLSDFRSIYASVREMLFTAPALI